VATVIFETNNTKLLFVNLLGNLGERAPVLSPGLDDSEECVDKIPLDRCQSLAFSIFCNHPPVSAKANERTNLVVRRDRSMQI
jgi:hypothetical protein